MNGHERRLVWIGSSKKDLMNLPVPIRKFFGHALHFAQRGEKHDSAKALKGFGDAGVLELIRNDAHGAYRGVYSVRFSEAVFVLHCFQKKSKSGIATPEEDMAVIRARLKVARIMAQEMRDAEEEDRRN